MTKEKSISDFIKILERDNKDMIEFIEAGIGEDEPRDIFRETVKAALTEYGEQCREEERKAFGGCTRCYGKGYSTRAYDEVGAEDFGGEGYIKAGQMEIRPCSCDRGKKIKKLVEIGLQ